MSELDKVEPTIIRETSTTIGLTMRDLLMEVRTNTQNLRTDFENFKNQVMLKSDFNAILEARKTARKYMITTILSIIAVGVSTIVAVVNIV